MLVMWRCVLQFYPLICRVSLFLNSETFLFTRSLWSGFFMFFSFIAAVMKSMMKKIKCRSLFLL